jgi:hypothetical protein
MGFPWTIEWTTVWYQFSLVSYEYLWQERLKS